MKKITTIVIFLCAFKITHGQLYENMGTPSSTTLITSYTSWQNNGLFTFSGTGDIRTTAASSGYISSSGNGNVYLTNNGTSSFQISGINTSLLTNPAINFGLYKSSNASDASELKFEYSINGSTYNQISIPTQPTGTGTANWRKIQLTGIPKSTTLFIRFTNQSTTTQFRIDDINLDDLTVLPISLTSFTGKSIDQNILLNWKTASEEHNDYFEIKRSADGQSFEAIGEIKGAGNSSILKDYTFTDFNPFAGTNYYQLVQHDFDGKTSSSQVIGINSKIAKAQLSVYASSSAIHISLSSPNQTEGVFQIFDVNGQKLSSQTTTIEKGYNTIQFPIALENGIYLIRYSSEGEILTQKFFK